MKTTTKVTTAMALLAGLLLNGCGAGSSSNSDYDFLDGMGTGNPGVSNSTVSVKPKSDGFVVTWKRKKGGYGEVIYTDDLEKKRGNGYPLTSNSSGTFTLTCNFSSEGYDSVYYRCKPSNVSYTKSLSLRKGVTYYWLASEGLNHEHGEVAAVMEYNDGKLSIQKH